MIKKITLYIFVLCLVLGLYCKRAPQNNGLSSISQSEDPAQQVLSWSQEYLTKVSDESIFTLSIQMLASQDKDILRSLLKHPDLTKVTDELILEAASFSQPSLRLSANKNDLFATAGALSIATLGALSISAAGCITQRQVFRRSSSSSRSESTDRGSEGLERSEKSISYESRYFAALDREKELKETTKRHKNYIYGGLAAAAVFAGAALITGAMGASASLSQSSSAKEKLLSRFADLYKTLSNSSGLHLAASVCGSLRSNLQTSKLEDLHFFSRNADTEVNITANTDRIRQKLVSTEVIPKEDGNAAESLVILGDVRSSPRRRTIGKGQWGKVSEVTVAKNKYAAKEIRPEATGELGDMVRSIATAKEIAVLQNLPKHPNILTYYGAYKDQNNQWMMVFEKADEDLAAFIERGGTLQRSEIVGLVGGMKALHDARITHGDIKPENIYVFGKDTKKIKVGDFGAAYNTGSLERFLSGSFLPKDIVLTLLYRRMPKEIDKMTLDRTWWQESAFTELRDLPAAQKILQEVEDVFTKAQGPLGAKEAENIFERYKKLWIMNELRKSEEEFIFANEIARFSSLSDMSFTPADRFDFIPEFSEAMQQGAIDKAADLIADFQKTFDSASMDIYALGAVFIRLGIVDERSVLLHRMLAINPKERPNIDEVLQIVKDWAANPKNSL